MSLQAPAPAIPPSMESGRKRERGLVPPVVSERSIRFREYVNRIHIQRVNEHEKKIHEIYGGFVPMKIKQPLSFANYQHNPK